MGKNIYWIPVGLCLLVYGSTLFFDFLAADDIPIIVKGPLIRDFWGSLQTGHIQNILYTIFYHLFGAVEFPFHLLSVVLHLLNTILLVQVGTKLLSRKVGVIAAILFAVHPVTTEAVSWISASHYLYNALALQVTLLAYIQYKKTNTQKQLFITLGIFTACLLFLQSVWLLLIPLVLLVVDICIIETKPSIYRVRHLILFAIPVVLHLTILMGSRTVARIGEYQAAEAMNQQKLVPFVESAPYSIYMMVKLYLFPQTLLFYYEGNSITPIEYWGMYVVCAVYAGLITFFLKKQKAIAGLMLMPIVLLLPALSPVRIAWSMAERYLYSGALFFCLLVGYLFVHYFDRGRFRHGAVYALSILTICYGGRSIIRVMDFQDTKHLSQATVQTAPGSLHAQTDLGMAYIMEQDYLKAEEAYYRVLAVLPDSFTAAHNLGYMYLQQGLPTKPVPLLPHDAQQLFSRAENYYKQGNFEVAFFYFYQSSLKDPENTAPKKKMVDMFSEVKHDELSEGLLHQIVAIEPQNVTAWVSLFAFKFNTRDYTRATSYLNKALAIEPTNKQLLKYQKLLQERTSQP